MKFLERHFYSSYIPWRLLGVYLLVELVVIFYFARSSSILYSFYPHLATYVMALVTVLNPIASGLLCGWGSFRHLRRSDPSDAGRLSRRFSPLFLAASGIIYGCAQAIWFGQLVAARHVPSFPAPSHFIEFMAYPCFIGAVLFLPARNVSPATRLRLLLDSLMIMAAVATLCLYYVLAPILVNGDGTTLAKVVGGLYPVADLLLMFFVLMVSLRSGERVLRPVLIMLGLAAILQFFANITHLEELLLKNYNEFSLANVGMIMYGWLLVGAAQTVNNILNKGEPAEDLRPPQADATARTIRWKAVLPSVLVLIFGLLLFTIWLRNGREMFPNQITIIYAGGSVVLILMILRQFLAMQQIGALQSRLRKRNRSLAILNVQLEKQATTDALTCLPNHRTVVEKLDEALARARAATASCSLIFIDIDHFKNINDYYGHLVGDMTLCCFAAVVVSGLREGECVGRWGGEEFVVVLPGVEHAEAVHRAEWIRAAVDQQVFVCDDGMNVTCSLGVATFPEDATERDELIRYADKAMYAAKRLGRNQIRLAREPLVLAMNAEARKPVAAREIRIPGAANALLALLEARDPALSQRARRVGELSLEIARASGLSEPEACTVRLAGLLHDLGKVAMPDTLLFKQKQPGEAELEWRDRYPLIGAEILAPVPSLCAVADIVRAHHAWMDGSGGPAGTSGEEIPLGARIVAVASAYDTLVQQRLSSRSGSIAEALRELRARAGSQFDPRVVEALARVLSVSPRLSEIDVA